MVPSLWGRRNFQIKSLAPVRAKPHPTEHCLQADRARIVSFSKTVSDHLAERSWMPHITGEQVGMSLPVVSSLFLDTNSESIDRRALNVGIQPPEIDPQNHNLRRGVWR